MTVPEFLVRLRIEATISEDSLAELTRAERERAAQLAVDGALVQLWRPAGQDGNIGLWRAESRDELDAALRSLPLWPYMVAEITELTVHPYDPAPHLE